MKTSISNLLISLLVASYSFAFAQQKKTTTKTIIVSNGDTTVNGKRIVDLSKEEHNQIKNKLNPKSESSYKKYDVMIHGKVSADTPNIQRFRQDFHSSLKDSTKRFHIRPRNSRIELHEDTNKLALNGDTLLPGFKKLKGNDRIHVMPPGENSIQIPNAVRERNRRFEAPRRFLERPNTQTFDFNNTDKNGFNTRSRINLSEPTVEEIAQITGSPDTQQTLTIENMVLFPNVTTGKINILFSLPRKGKTTVKVIDSENKVLFSDTIKNFTGTYFKQANLPKNGIYYISVNQSNNWFVKRMVKD